MSIHVICSGCLKRFQVAARFAGLEGPCPKCGAVISIPKTSVKLHEEETTQPRRDKKGRIITRPIQRFDLELDPVKAKYYALGVLAVVLLTCLLGWIPMGDTLRSAIGVLGLCLIAFPLTLFGYHFLRDRDKIFFFAGAELYRRTVIVAAGYVFLWLFFEYLLAATGLASIGVGTFLACIYFIVFAILATLLAYPLLELKLRDALLHFCVFALTVIVLRFLIGLGWFWESSGWIRGTSAPPPPFLPGM